jgi:hypothetical protein
MEPKQATHTLAYFTWIDRMIGFSTYEPCADTEFCAGASMDNPYLLIM